MSPGTALLAAALGVSLVALLSAATAILAVPAMLVLAGPLAGHRRPALLVGRRSERRPRRAPPRAGRRWRSAPRCCCSRHASPSSGCAPARPPRSRCPRAARRALQYDTVATSMGAGWTEPFEIVAVARKGAVTTASRLAALERAQRKIARDPAVRAVLGPGTIARSAERLRSAGRRAVDAQRGHPRKAGGRLRSLGKNVSSAADGVESLRSSLSSADDAATRLASRLARRDRRRRLAAQRPQRRQQRRPPPRRPRSPTPSAGRAAVESQSAAASSVRSRRPQRRARARHHARHAGHQRTRPAEPPARTCRCDHPGAVRRARPAPPGRRRRSPRRNARSPAMSLSGIRPVPRCARPGRRSRPTAAAALDDPMRELGLDAQYAASIATTTRRPRRRPPRDRGRQPRRQRRRDRPQGARPRRHRRLALGRQRRRS